MKKLNIKLFLLLTAFTFTTLGNAQKTKLKEIVGPEYIGKNAGRGWAYDFIRNVKYNNQNFLLAIKNEARLFLIGGRINNTSARLYKLDDKNNVKETIDISMSPDKALGTYHDVVQMGDYLFLFYTIKNKKDKKVYLFCTRYSFANKTQKFFKMGEHAIADNSGFHIMVNAQKTKMSILTGSLFYKGKRKSKTVTGEYDYIVLNEDLETLNYGTKIKLESKAGETILAYYITPDNSLLVVTQKNADFKKSSSSKSKKKPLLARRESKSAQQYFLNVLNNGENTKIKLDEELYLRGFYALVENDSFMQIFCYYTNDGTKTTGIVKKQFNLTTLEIESSANTPFSESGSESLESVTDSKKEAEVKNKKREDKNKKALTKSTFSNLDRINSVTKLENGTYVVFGEGFYWYTVTTRTTDSKGNTSTRTDYYYVYGPGGLIWVDTSGEILNKAIIDYKIEYKNYNPGFCGVANSVPDNGYLVATSQGYALVDFTKPVYKIKEFKNDESKRRRFKWGNKVIPSEEGFMIANVRKKKLVVTTLGVPKK